MAWNISMISKIYPHLTSPAVTSDYFQAETKQNILQEKFEYLYPCTVQQLCFSEFKEQDVLDNS